MHDYECICYSDDLVFSNLVKLKMGVSPFYLDEGFPADSVLLLATIQERFSTARFPALRVLEFDVKRDGFELMHNRALGVLWKTLVNLEELHIYNTSNQLGNEAFFGSDVGAPPFLQLTKLKKFSLEIPPEHGLTDAVFCHIFRQMKLKEFYLKSSEPIKGISKYVIWSMLTGPFFESIEKFPFRDWSLSDTSPEEFLELARKFPNNQAL